MTQLSVHSNAPLWMAGLFALTVSMLSVSAHALEKYPGPGDEPGIIAVETPVAANSYSLTVEPSAVPLCPGRKRAVVQVSWSSSDPALKLVEICVAGPREHDTQLFASGGAQGMAKTGELVVEGVRFIMVDCASSKTLASREVAGLSCV